MIILAIPRYIEFVSAFLFGAFESLKGSVKGCPCGRLERLLVLGQLVEVVLPRKLSVLLNLWDKYFFVFF